MKLYPYKVKYTRYIYFTKNLGSTSGSSLFGGLLDRCTVSPFAEKYKESVLGVSSGFKYLELSSNIRINSVSSDPVKVCFCRESQPDCTYQPPTIYVMKGQKFVTTVVAVDQVNHTVMNATIRSFLSSKLGGLGENQLNQTTTDSCTDLQFEIFSPQTTEELVMYADGPCKDAVMSQRRLKIHFSLCTCPIGFQPKVTELTRCVCECKKKLDMYVTNCDPQTESLERKGDTWITYIKTTDNSSSGYMIYPHCPLDYCHSSDSNIKINLNVPNGADAQCANHRSGLLCGTCQTGYSLSIGSSHCIACPRYWPALLTTGIIAALLAGIVLIALLLVLNLTVAVGTVNGIIFYTGIINAHSSTFLPFRKQNFITVILSWLSLDLGLETCFFKGMDAFWKTLIMLAFPFYLILLVVVMIIISEHSTRFAQLIGKKNPVATLDTLILLSYTKFLHVVIVSFSFAVLDYPDGSRVVVWLPDATVSYLKGKHVILFLIAFLILLVGVVYTVILFSWQWLLRHQRRKCFKWVRHQKLIMFLDPYHAPFTIEHRYWTGLLLIIRALLYIISAANISSDPRINILAIGIAMICLFLLKGYSQGSTIYRKWSIDVLEMACYVNIVLFCLSESFTFDSNRHRSVVAYVSVSITFVLFLVILTYHIFTELFSKTKLWEILKSRYKISTKVNNDCQEWKSVQPTVTYSEVAGPSRESNDTQLSLLIEASESDHQTALQRQVCDNINGGTVTPELSSQNKTTSYQLMD